MITRDGGNPKAASLKLQEQTSGEPGEFHLVYCDAQIFS
jgi:hypothetical protein